MYLKKSLLDLLIGFLCFAAEETDIDIQFEFHFLRCLKYVTFQGPFKAQGICEKWRNKSCILALIYRYFQYCRP